MDFVFTDFSYLSINWINDGAGAKDIYPSGSNIDLSHGETRCCLWNWKASSGLRTGLVFVQCRRCQSNGQAIVTAEGSIRLPCNQNVFDTGSTHP